MKEKRKRLIGRFVFWYLISEVIQFIFQVPRIFDYEQIGWKEVLLDIGIFAIGYLLVEASRYLEEFWKKENIITPASKVTTILLALVMILIFGKSFMVIIFDVQLPFTESRYVTFGMILIQAILIDILTEVMWIKKDTNCLRVMTRAEEKTKK